MKRSYQKIQEDEDEEDDDYRNYTSPRNTGSSATQLVGFQETCPGITVSMPPGTHTPLLSDGGAGEGSAGPGERRVG